MTLHQVMYVHVPPVAPIHHPSQRLRRSSPVSGPHSGSEASLSEPKVTPLSACGKNKRRDDGEEGHGSYYSVHGMYMYIVECYIVSVHVIMTYPGLRSTAVTEEFFDLQGHCTGLHTVVPCSVPAVARFVCSFFLRQEKR